MSAKHIITSHKTTIVEILCSDYTLVLNKVHEKILITGREYNNLKRINKVDVEGHVVELVDKVLNKGEDPCQAFLNLLQTDEEMKSTFPQLNISSLQLTPAPAPSEDTSAETKTVKHEDGQRIPEELEARFNDTEYKNWLKAAQCLFILKKGLLPFIIQHMRVFHKDLLTKNAQLKEPCQAPCKTKGNKPCDGCSEWQSEIMKHHRLKDTDQRSNPKSMINWNNCSPPSWRTDCWELMKAYMPRGQWKVKSADDCDTSALLYLIKFCDIFQSVDVNVVGQVIEHRNDLMHSSNFRMTEEWMSQYKTSLKNLVQQFSCEQMETAGQRIEKILSVDLSIWLTSRDQKDSDVFKELESDSVNRWDLITKWEAGLLLERLQLLHADEDTKSQDTEQLKSLGCFLQANRDLIETFATELKAITSAENREEEEGQ